jgi:hypothetical protein
MSPDQRNRFQGLVPTKSTSYDVQAPSQYPPFKSSRASLLGGIPATGSDWGNPGEENESKRLHETEPRHITRWRDRNALEEDLKKSRGRKGKPRNNNGY